MRLAAPAAPCDLIGAPSYLDLCHWIRPCFWAPQISRARQTRPQAPIKRPPCPLARAGFCGLARGLCWLRRQLPAGSPPAPLSLPPPNPLGRGNKSANWAHC